MSTFYATQGDSWPPLVAELRDGRNLPITLDGATVRFSMILDDPSATTPKVNDQPCAVEDASTGRVRYEWQAGDTNAVGQFNARFKITLSNGKPVTVPSSGYDRVIVQKKF